MSIFAPLVPLAIAAFLLLVGALDAVSKFIPIAITIAWILVIASSAFTLYCNFTEKSDPDQKVWSSVVTIAATVITMIMSKNFLTGLAATAQGSGLGATLEFGLALFLGGSVWLCCVCLCSYAAMNSMDKYGDGNFRTICALIGSLVLGGIFGLLG